MYLQLLNKFGVGRVLVVIILATDAVSAGLTAVFLLLVQGWVSGVEIAAAVILPTLIAPFVVYTSLRNMLHLHRVECMLQRKNEELERAIGEIRQLSGLLPICASCKRIRDGQGDWNQLETYISQRSGAKFSHGLCPECASRLYPPAGS